MPCRILVLGQAMLFPMYLKINIRKYYIMAAILLSENVEFFLYKRGHFVLSIQAFIEMTIKQNIYLNTDNNTKLLYIIIKLS